MDYTDPQYRPTLIGLAQSIDTLDYFQILNLQQNATERDIRTTYYQMARALHPDRFFQMDDQELKLAVGKIYRRVTEAYTILKEQRKRSAYLQNILGPDREKKLRFTEESEREQKEQQRAKTAIARTPKGKQMHAAAMAEVAKGNLDKAIKNLQSAMLFESGNERLKELIAELKEKKAAS